MIYDETEEIIAAINKTDQIYSNQVGPETDLTKESFDRSMKLLRESFEQPNLARPPTVIPAELAEEMYSTIPSISTPVEFEPIKDRLKIVPPESFSVSNNKSATIAEEVIELLRTKPLGKFKLDYIAPSLTVAQSRLLNSEILIGRIQQWLIMRGYLLEPVYGGVWDYTSQMAWGRFLAKARGVSNLLRTRPHIDFIPSGLLDELYLLELGKELPSILQSKAFASTYPDKRPIKIR